MMIEMGLDPSDFETGYDDPELKALEKTMKRLGKLT
jgi:hypothetical protein